MVCYVITKCLFVQNKNIWLSVIDMLTKTKKMPAVAFIFSRRLIGDTAAQLESVDLTDQKEKSQIHHFFERSINRLKGSDRQLPQVSRWKNREPSDSSTVYWWGLNYDFFYLYFWCLKLSIALLLFVLSSVTKFAEFVTRLENIVCFFYIGCRFAWSAKERNWDSSQWHSSDTQRSCRNALSERTC